MTEVLPFVAQRFRCSGRLGITGRSSGGFGALSLTRQFPGQVHAIACHAGDMAFETTYLSELTASIMPIQAAGGPMPFVEAFWRKRRLSGGDFAAMNYLCMAAAYGGDLEAEDFPARLPVNWKTGAIDWSAYHAGIPLTHCIGLKTLPPKTPSKIWTSVSSMRAIMMSICCTLGPAVLWSG